MEDDYKYSDSYAFTSNIPYEDFSFLSSQNYCVGFVNMVRPTNIALDIKDDSVRKRCGIFLDLMVIIARNFGVKIIKRVEDSILFYFPMTSDTRNKSAFDNMLVCGLTMLEARKIVNIEIEKIKLRPVDYMVGIDHGRLDITRALISKDEPSIFPTSLHMKTKHMSESNMLVIGQDLYQILNLLGLAKKDYIFKEISRYMLNVEESYSVYEVDSPKSDEYRSFLTKILPSLKRQKEKSKKEKIPNIMIVDDEEDVLLTFRSFLMDMKYNVDTFKSVSEAMSHLVTVEPDYYDLILTDIRMVPTNGLQFYTKLRALNHKSRIVFISAIDAAAQLPVMISEVKQDFVLQKPVSKEKFLQTITAALENEQS